MDYSQILSELFVGSHPRGGDEIDELKRETGISAVLNLQTDEDMRYFNLDWQTLEAHYAACRIELHRLPVRDFDPVDLREKLPACVRELNDLLSTGHTVFLHCTAGAGRAPTVAIAYLMWNRGWSLAEAVTHVQQRRPSYPNVKAIQLATRDLSEE